MTDKDKLVERIAEICSITIEDAASELDSCIHYLQELKLEGDLQISDYRCQCEGLLGLTFDADFMSYATAMTQEENIPNELKELHTHDEEEEFEDNSKFNPFEYEGWIGHDLCVELAESMY